MKLNEYEQVGGPNVPAFINHPRRIRIMTDSIEYIGLRHSMVEEQIIAEGVRDPLVIKAIQAIPRELFVPDELRELAYENTPLPIGEGQTISQPFIVALMIESLALKGGETILEIGTGSGYAAAILAQIGEHVYTIERIKSLAMSATKILRSLGCDSVTVLHRDGTEGYPEKAPYDAIIVAASGPKVPEALKEQLKIGGRLIIPVGSNKHEQRLIRITRESKSKFQEERLEGVRFVPLIGAHGWNQTS